MNLREAAKMALEALVAAYQGKDKTGQVTDAITALRAALAEPEPVMHQYKYQAYGYYKEDGKLKLGTIPEPQTTHWEGCEEVHPECRKPEPVAWMSQGGDVARSKRYLEKMGFSNLIPLYTAPTPRKWVGLTQGEIDDLYIEHHDEHGYALSPNAYEHAIEAKLKEKNT